METLLKVIGVTVSLSIFLVGLGYLIQMVEEMIRDGRTLRD